MTAISWFGFPLRSHTAPSLPLVAALIDAGAEVTFHTTARYRPLVETTGARVVEYPPICACLERAKDLRAHVRDVTAVSDALAPVLIAAPPAELVIFDASAFWGRIVAGAHRTPSVSSVTTFVLTRSMVQLLGRSTAMTDADADVLATAGDLKVAYTSTSFQPAGSFFDHTHLFVGPLLESRPRDGVRVAPEGSRPLAYVSFGTIYGGDMTVLRQIAAQLSAAGWQVVVSLGGARAVDGEWPPHVRAFPFVDQLAVLAHARLVVSHGGLQTVTEALAFGVPLIVIPQDVDQHLVGQRAAGLGAAVTLSQDAPTSASFAAAVARIDTEREQFERAAAAIGRSFADAMPLSAAVQRLLALARSGRRDA